MPSRWWEVYPQGTKEGDEENKFFCALSRHPDEIWRSVEDISNETKLSTVRIDEIICKYYTLGIIYQCHRDPELWGYWERVGEKKPEIDIKEEENSNRLKKKQ